MRERTAAQEANTGNPLAMLDLGHIYTNGLGRDAEPQQAQEWYAKALTAFLDDEKIEPDPYTQRLIGWMFLHGVGTAQDEAAALPWLGKSADHGNTFAKYALGKVFPWSAEKPSPEMWTGRWSCSPSSLRKETNMPSTH